MGKKRAATALTVTTHQKINRKDTSSANGRAIVIQALRICPQTTVQLRDVWGVMAPAPRVLELREAGNVIHTHRVKATTGDGVNHHGVARYVLLKEASQQ
jgi:Helix-turn-helix domain